MPPEFFLEFSLHCVHAEAVDYSIQIVSSDLSPSKQPQPPQPQRLDFFLVNKIPDPRTTQTHPYDLSSSSLSLVFPHIRIQSRYTHLQASPHAAHYYVCVLLRANATHHSSRIAPPDPYRIHLSSDQTAHHTSERSSQHTHTRNTRAPCCARLSGAMSLSVPPSLPPLLSLHTVFNGSPP